MKVAVLLASFLLLNINPIQEERRSGREVSVLNKLGNNYINSYPDSAFYYAKLALEEANSRNDIYNLAQAKKTLGQVFYMQGVYDYAISYLSQALDSFEDLELDKESVQARLALGSAYQFHNLWDEAILEYRHALNLASGLGDSSELAKTYGIIGHYYEKLGDTDSGFYYQEKAQTLYAASNDYVGLSIIYDNIGSLHEDLESYEIAYDYFMLSSRYDSLSNNLPALANTLNNIADTYRKRGVFDEAIYYTNKALRMADSLGLGYEKLSAYEDLNKVYREQGNAELAMAYFDSAYQFSETLFNSQIAGQIANFQTLYETQAKEREISILESQHRIETQTRNTLIIGSALLFVFLSLITYQERKRRTKEKEAHKAQEALSDERIKNIELSEKSLKTELENKRLKEEQFYLEIEARSQDLTNKTLHIIQKNRLLNELRDQITVLHKESKIKSNAVKKLSNSIDKGFQFDREWEHFQDSFDQVHVDFAKRIKDDYPKLTETDVRLSALIRMGLSSKDIANILGITTDSLRVSKSRLKKKLNPNTESGLKSFLVNY